jgi:AcrR family transcriptional regulator
MRDHPRPHLLEIQAVSATDPADRIVRPTNGRFDGRRLRSERTRHLIIEAYLALLQETRSMPTAAEIARRAGYSVRSIFERFADLDALSLATADYAIALGQSEAVATDVEGDRPTRIRSHVRTRAQACEKWLPLWRILTAKPIQEQLPETRTRVVAVRRANVARLELMYATALAALTSFESWEQLRVDFGLDWDDALDVWRSALDRLLPAAR